MIISHMEEASSLSDVILCKTDNYTSDEKKYLYKLICALESLEEVVPDSYIMIRDVEGKCLYSTNIFAKSVGFFDAKEFLNTDYSDIDPAKLKMNVNDYLKENNLVMKTRSDFEAYSTFGLDNIIYFAKVHKRAIYLDKNRILGIIISFNRLYTQDIFCDNLYNITDMDSDKIAFFYMNGTQKNIFKLNDIDQQICFLLCYHFKVREIAEFISRFSLVNYTDTEINKHIATLYKIFKVRDIKQLIPILCSYGFNQVPKQFGVFSCL